MLCSTVMCMYTYSQLRLTKSFEEKADGDVRNLSIAFSRCCATNWQSRCCSLTSNDPPAPPPPAFGSCARLDSRSDSRCCRFATDSSETPTCSGIVEDCWRDGEGTPANAAEVKPPNGDAWVSLSYRENRIYRSKKERFIRELRGKR